VRCFGEEDLTVTATFIYISWLLLHSSMLPGFWGLLPPKQSKDDSSEERVCDQGAWGAGERSSQTQIVRVCWIMTQHRCVGQRFFWFIHRAVITSCIGVYRSFFFFFFLFFFLLLLLLFFLSFFSDCY
jgi:hypothetical protein